MSGFLHQLASRSLGLAPQIKSRAALPYAAPAADFSMTEVASHGPTPAIERQRFEPPHNTQRNEQAMDNALPAPFVAESPAPATHVEMKTSTPSASQPPRLSAQQLPDHAPLETAHSRQPAPPAIIASPIAAEPKSIPRHLDPAPETSRPAENNQPALRDIESLVTRLLGDNKNPPEKSPESAAPPTVVTAHQASQRPAEISTIRPQSTRERQSTAPEIDTSPEVHITIGRLEVNPPSRPAPAAQPPRPRGPAPLSLSDYLARRNGGRS
jgi:hypothetical protein